MTFGKNLKKIRESLGLTAAELARMSDLTPAAISQIENGERDPSLSTILKILKVIPVKFEKLIEDDHG
jgi:HTH-type transcriptional regulator, competence development regulator